MKEPLYTPDGFCVGCGVRQDMQHHINCWVARTELVHPSDDDFWRLPDAELSARYGVEPMKDVSDFWRWYHEIGHAAGRHMNARHMNAAVQARSSKKKADGAKRALAAMLLMREVLCEQVYRQMQRFKSSGAGELADHPCRALKMRDITPERLEIFVRLDILDMEKDALRVFAAKVLDACEARP